MPSEFPDTLKKTDPLRAAFAGGTERRRVAVPRESLRAVQLCPWKVVVQNPPNAAQTTWSVQGLLVFAESLNDKYARLPLLLTGDFAGAARLMQRLAATLGIPYLFGADADGFEAERIRAQSRPPLRSGGTQT